MSTQGLTRTPAQLFGLAFGIVYLVVGLVGFAITGFDNFASETDEKLLVFAINPLHNVAHLGVGALLLVGSAKHETAKSINLVVGLVYLLLGILGLAGGVVVEDLLNNNAADTWLHIATAALAIYFGTAGAARLPTARTA
ncbi:MAG TPA: DUF4383 domain-containing protein [Actinomycetota bacterium]|nr:DUF4383 domain-containing protein [Actinomycetota bacterium]